MRRKIEIVFKINIPFLALVPYRIYSYVIIHCIKFYNFNMIVNESKTHFQQNVK